MIISTEADVTPKVLEAIAKAPDPRLREILSALVRHLHEFAREVRLTEAEFQRAVGYVAALGQHTNETHNEVVLMSGSLGFSALICLLNNGDNGQTETMANLLGPFWRLNSPATESGGSIVRSPTPGPTLFVDVLVRDREARPIAGVEIDIWQSSPEGLYDIQDDSQVDMNLRGKFTSGPDGRFSFRTVLPAGYPIPITGPVGEMLKGLGRHNMRPAHLHFLAFKTGYKTLVSQIYVDGDRYLEDDVQFGVTRALVGDYVRHDDDAGAPAPDVTAPWYSLDQSLVMEPGEARLPRPPIK